VRRASRRKPAHGYPQRGASVQVFVGPELGLRGSLFCREISKSFKITTGAHNLPTCGHSQGAAPHATHLVSGASTRHIIVSLKGKTMKMRKSTMFVAAFACSLFAACGSNSSTAEVDTDQDGLTDAIEAELRTNPQDVDTDHDGVYDGREHFFGSDPRRGDSDSNGVSDGDEDFDGNGRCEREEHQFGPFRRGGRGGHGDGGVPQGHGNWGGGDAGPGQFPGQGGQGPDFSGEGPDFSGERPDFGGGPDATGEGPDFSGERPDFGGGPDATGEGPDFSGERPDFGGDAGAPWGGPQQ
jgi:hypothetical protein